MLLLLCGVVVVAVRVAGPEPEVRVRESTEPTRTVVVLPEGQAKVTGEIESLKASAEVVDPVVPPFDVGAARAVIGGALADGARVSAEWTGPGELLRIDGDGGGIDASPATVGAGKGFVVVRLDGTPRPLLPGSYRVAAPVVVAAPGGLGSPRRGVTFTADGTTTLESDGVVWITPRPLRLEGPGTVELTGALRVRTRDGERTATTLRFGPGPFEVAITPRDGERWSVDATLQGPLDVQG